MMCHCGRWIGSLPTNYKINQRYEIIDLPIYYGSRSDGLKRRVFLDPVRAFVPESGSCAKRLGCQSFLALRIFFSSLGSR